MTRSGSRWGSFLARGPLDEGRAGGWRLLAGRLRGLVLGRRDEVTLPGGVRLVCRCGGDVGQEMGVVVAGLTEVRLERWEEAEAGAQDDGDDGVVLSREGACSLSGGADDDELAEKMREMAGL